MSNPTVSFRISNYHLARGLRAIRQLEPNWQLTTTSDLIRTIFQDYIAKSEHQNNSPLDVTPELLQEIAIARLESNQKQSSQLETFHQLGIDKQQPQKSDQQIQRELEEERIFTALRQEALAKIQQEAPTKNDLQSKQDEDIDNQIELSKQALKRTLQKPSEFNDPNKTESKISTVTDFSPPKDWIDSES